MVDGPAGGKANPAQRLSLLVCDVDGTLVTQNKVLTQATIAAARRLWQVGIAFAIVSSRPPRGMTMLAQPLGLELFGGFNGGAIVRPDLSIVERHLVPPEGA